MHLPITYGGNFCPEFNSLGYQEAMQRRHEQENKKGEEKEIRNYIEVSLVFLTMV